MGETWPYPLDTFPVGCVVSDARRHILYVNAFLKQHFGYADHDPTGEPFFTLLSRGSQIIFDSYLMPLIMKEKQCHEIRLSLVAPDGSARPVVVSARLDETLGERIFWCIVDAARSETLFKELTRARELLQQKNQLLHTLADTDQLTGLPNRSALAHYLNEQLDELTASPRAFALAFVDLDGFKAVNDTHGHAMGDALLQQVAKRMSHSLRRDDMVARFGGDEFVILLQGDFAAGQAQALLTRLVRQLCDPFEVDSVLLQISASVGVTRYPQPDAIDPDQLIRQADQAMYQAKLFGRNRICVFNLEKEQTQRGEHQELAAIQAALADEQFALYYQPKVNMRTGEILGAEALLRWHHPVQGLLGPAELLATVSETPTGVALGQWVLRRALTQMAQWREQGLDLPVSVNVDTYHLQVPDFLDQLGRLLADVPELPRDRLEIEVLETGTIDDLEHVSAVLAACRQQGIRVALDDFGTGYSTLNHLRHLAVDVLKVDRSFVQGMHDHAGDLAILRGIIGFARAFACELFGEGVETWQHGQSLIELGCEVGQGFYIARPMPAPAMAVWIENWQRRAFHQTFARLGASQAAGVGEESSPC